MRPEKAEGPVTVLIVDGVRLARETFRLQLEDPYAIRVVGIVGDGFEALILLESLKPDIVLTHIDIIDPDARTLIAQLSAMVPPVPLALIVPEEEQQLAAEALRWGAAACVCERSGLSELPGAIRAAALGDRLSSAGLCTAMEP